MSGKRTSEGGNMERGGESDEDNWLGGGYSRSQSQTIGVLLIAGVVLVLAAATALFVVDIGADSEDSVFVDIETEVTTDGVAITHESGDTIPIDELTLVVDTGTQRAEESFADIESSIDSFSAGDRAVADDENDLGFTDTDTAEQLAAGTTVQVIHEPTSTLLVDKGNVQASGDTTIEAFSVNLNIAPGSGGSGQSVGTLSQSQSGSKDKLAVDYQFEAGNVLDESVNGTVTLSGDLLDDANSSLAEFSKSSDFELGPGDTVDDTLQWNIPIQYATEAHGFDVRLNVSIDEADIGLNESAGLDVEPAEVGKISVDETATELDSPDTLNVSLDVPNTGDLSTPNRSIGVQIKNKNGEPIETDPVSIEPDGETVSVAIDTDDVKSSVSVAPVVEANGTEEIQENQTQEIPLPAFGQILFDFDGTDARNNVPVNVTDVVRTGGNVTLVFENAGKQITRQVGLGVEEPANETGNVDVTESAADLDLELGEPLNATLYKSAEQEVRLSEAQITLKLDEGDVWNDDRKKLYDTIQQAIKNATNRNTILVAAGSYNGVDIARDVTIKAADGAEPSITQNSDTVVTVSASEVTIDGLKIEQKSAADGYGEKASVVELADIGATENAALTLKNNNFTSRDTFVDIQQTDMSSADVTITNNTFNVPDLSVSELDGLTHVADASNDLTLNSDSGTNNNVLDENEFAPNVNLDNGNLVLAENPIEDWNDLNDVRNIDRISPGQREFIVSQTPLVLENDLDSETAGYSDLVEENGFTPIAADDAASFIGTFDGNGKTISDFDTKGEAGLFGKIATTTIRDLTIENATITEDTLPKNDGTGALAGYALRSNIKDVNIINTDVTKEGNVKSQNKGTGSVVGYGNIVAFENITVSNTTVTVNDDSNPDASRAGGVVGKLDSSEGFQTESKIIDSSVDVNVSGVAELGGLIGGAFGEAGITIKRTSVNSTVDLSGSKAGANFGGLIGLADSSGPVTIDKTKFTGEVAGGVSVGGFVGKTGTQLDITNSFSNAERYELDTEGGGLVGVIDGPMTVENTYAAGIDAAITSKNGKFGGIGGRVGSSGSIAADSVYLDNDTDVPYIRDGSADISGVNSPGASAMKGSSATSTMSDFDFVNTWETRTNPDDFPDLRTFN